MKNLTNKCNANFQMSAYLMIVVAALVIALMFLSGSVHAIDYPLMTPNSIQEPTNEDIARAKARIELCNKYVSLKSQGEFEDALQVLKTIWPNTDTSLNELENSMQSGSNQVDTLSPIFGAPMETFAPQSLSLRTVVQQRAISVNHYSQKECYYCGPAAIRIMISNQNANPPSQSELASKQYLNTDNLGNTGFDDRLTNTLNTFMTTNGAYELAWGGIFTSSSIKNAIISTIDAGYPILANGISGGNDSIITLPWYPEKTYHFICVYGYGNYGATTYVCDPVAYADCRGFEKVIPKYGYATDTFYKFVYPRGIVY